METVSSFDRARIEELEAKAKLADLEIETAGVNDLPALLFAEKNQTVGQTIMLANYIDALRVITDFRDEALTKAKADAAAGSYLRPDTSERRGGTVSAPNGGYAYNEQQGLFQGMIPPETEVPTVNGPVAYGDIPRDASGSVSDEWIDDNCTCADHEQQRIDRDKKAAGFYL